MKLISYRLDGQDRYGAVIEGGIVDLSKRPGAYGSLRELIAGDGLGKARAAVAGAAPDHRLSAVTMLPPVVAPENIWCIGVNYAHRNEEYKDNSERPKYPSLFCRSPHSIVGHEQPLIRPKVSTQLDYEGEITLVIGRGGRHIPREQALDHIFGLTLCNEGSVRDWLRHGKFNVTQGKNFDRSGSVGPWIVTSDAIDLRAPIHLTTRVNGEVRQDDSTERLMFPFDALISYLSTFATLTPGDLIVTGTPTGSGARFDPPRWLKPGDVVEVEASGIGILRNAVADEV